MVVSQAEGEHMGDEKNNDKHSLRTAITAKVFGEEAAKLDADARTAALDGHLIDSAKLGLQGMVAGTAHVVNSLVDPIRNLVAAGESVGNHDGAPSTPPKPGTQGKSTPKR
jgi:hypothetical protein